MENAVTNSVMIVDDSVFMRFKLKQILEDSGFHVTAEAQSGKEALEKYSALKPGVVTMDIVMPSMDGVSALRAIKQVDPAARIIMVSSAGLRDQVRESLRAGAKGFIVKPFKDDQVVKVIEQAFK